MHNLINQMLLALKVEPAANTAIEALKSGKKPVLTVANTMESFLNDYAAELGIEHGGVIEADFSRVLERYLERTRTISIRKPFMKKGEKAEKKRLTDAELGPIGVAAYNRAKAAIEGLDLSNLPISPIDALKDRIRKAGYTVGEITGRGSIVDYSEPEARLRSRPGSELSIRGRREAINGYNGGKLDALVINQAGATGLSLHASERFKDQRQRKMIIVQPEANIDTHMQMLGRVHRTGQVIVPTYAQLIADIPAEKRPAAVLAKKMASLNANTTASRGGALTAKDVPDFINQYGDAVAHAYMLDHPEMNQRLGMPLKPNENGTIEREDAMRKVTGRIPLLSLKEQEEVYSHLESEYDALLKQMDAAGENALEAKTLDLKAKTTETTQVVPPKGGSNSPFAAPVTMEKVKASRLGKPYSSAEVATRAVDELAKQSEQAKAYIDKLKESGPDLVGPENAAQWLKGFGDPQSPMGRASAVLQNAIQLDAVDAYNTYKRHILDDVEDPKKQEAERVRLDGIKDRFTAIHSMTPIGARVTLRTSNGNLSGVVLHSEQKGSPKNPLALSTWKVTIAIPDASRQITLPFSRLWEKDKSDPDSETAIEIEPTPAWIESPAQTAERFDQLQSEVKEDRYIATGNLLAAYDWLNKKGQIVHFTDDQGNARQGILTARSFELAEHAKNKAVPMHTAGQVKEWLDRNEGRVLKTDDDAVSILKQHGGGYNVTTARSKREGGRYYLDKEVTALTGDFVSRGGRMVADNEVSQAKVTDLIGRLQALGARFAAPSEKPLETVKVGEPPAQSAQRISPAEWTRRREIEQAVRTALNQVAGFDVATRARIVDEITGPVSKEWANSADDAIILGEYDYAKELATIAMARNPDAVKVAFHEGWHAIERVLTEPEKALLSREADRLRDFIARNEGETYERAYLNDVANSEIFAEAAAVYTRMRSQNQNASGLHIAVRRILEKLYELFARIKNALNGLGFKSAEDVFKPFQKGEMARRAERADVPPAEGTAQSIIPRAADIRESIADRFGPKLKTVTEGVYDLSKPVRDLQTELEARHLGTFSDAQDFYVKKRLFPGRRATEVEDFNKQHLDPLVKALRDQRVNLEDAGQYLYARHAEERNAAIDRINPGLDGEGSGMSNADAQATLDRFAAQPNARAFDDLSRRLAGIRDFILDTYERGGLEKPEVLRAWRDQYEHYVPLKGFEDAPDEAPQGTGKGFNVRGPEVKRAFGRSSRADNPLVNLIDQAYRAIDRAERNIYLQSMHDALRSIGHDANDIATYNRGEPRREIDKGTGLVRTVDTSPNVMAPNVVSLKIGGNPVNWTFKDTAIAEAVKRMSPDSLGMFQFLVNIQNKLKAIWTHYSPDFLVRHFLFRYPIEGTLNSFEQKESGPHSVSRYIADAVPFLGHASRAIFARNAGKEAGEYGRYWDEMREHGGAMTFRSMRDMDLLREHLQTQLMALKGRPVASVRQRWRKTIEAMDVVTNALDNSLRLAAYVSARKQGKTPQQAALIAREATVDFQLKGKWSNAIALWAPFGSVANATAARMTKAVYRSKTMRRVFMGTMLAGFMAAMFNYLVGGNDKDGVPFFDKLPDWDKRLNFIIINPFDKDDKGRPIPIKIPMPYNWALPLAMGYAFGNMIFGTLGAGKAISLVTHAMMESLTPFGSEADKRAYLVPELGRPAYHVATNQQFSGAPIHVPAEQANAKYGRNVQRGPNAYTSWQRPTPEQQVGQGWELIARGLNNATGGNEKKAGALDLYPEDYREMLGYIVGTPIRFGQEVTGTASSLIKGEQPKSTRIPLMRVFRGADYDAADRAAAFERGRASRQPWRADH
jgi:hypothetical protein